MQHLPVTCLGFLEFIGTTELLVVLFASLLVFGPRKLPELGRSLGQALNQVRAVSDDFKRTWEAEAEREGAARGPRTSPATDAPDVEGAGGADDSAREAEHEAEADEAVPAFETLPAEAKG
jgi:sec-independent protein translocase protein TatA